MTILSALASATLVGAPPPGYAEGKVGVVVGLHPDGRIASVNDVRAGAGRKRVAATMVVPQPVKRTVAIAPNFLWDKTAYALGVTAGAGKRTADEHAAFVEKHREWLAGTGDEGLLAFLAFLDAWSPSAFAPPLFQDDMRDENVVFALERERLAGVYLHARPAACAVWASLGARVDAASVCLVTGVCAPAARLHPAIKGVWGGQSSGGSIVAFNQDAFTSYGHVQGDNAPVSEAAASAYTAALNRFLATGSGHRVQIGDASTVFWAEPTGDGDGADADDATEMFGGMLDAVDPEQQSRRVGESLEAIRKGIPLETVAPDVAEVRFHVLGLAPNAARLSIRFWFDDDFGVLARNFARYAQDIAIEPAPRPPLPPLWRTLAELAVQGKRENVPPNLAGDTMRAILAGTRYPATLLATALMRIRADPDRRVDAIRAGILKAVLTRNYGDAMPRGRDEDHDSAAYQLGRLFALIEKAQREALGRGINATVADRYYASASATPARVFPTLLRGARHHIADARKQGKGGWLDPMIGAVMARLPADLPPTLRLEDQGRFAVGYYHEKYARAPGKAEADAADSEPTEGEDNA